MNRNGLLLWITAGAGVLFLYSALTNVTPQSVITTQLGTGERVPINPVGTPSTNAATVASVAVTPIVAIVDGITGIISNGPAKIKDLSKGTGGYKLSPKTQITAGGGGR